MSKRELLLSMAAALMEAQPAFKVGDVVTWKDGLRNKRLDGDLVVTEVFEAPVFDPVDQAGSPYFREPLTMKVAYLDGDGDLIEVHVDSRRFCLA